MCLSVHLLLSELFKITEILTRCVQTFWCNYRSGRFVYLWRLVEVRWGDLALTGFLCVIRVRCVRSAGQSWSLCCHVSGTCCLIWVKVFCWPACRSTTTTLSWSSTTSWRTVWPPTWTNWTEPCQGNNALRWPYDARNANMHFPPCGSCCRDSHMENTLLCTSKRGSFLGAGNLRIFMPHYNNSKHIFLILHFIRHYSQHFFAVKSKKQYLSM